MRIIPWHTARELITLIYSWLCRYELLLLGSMELDSACFSLAVVPDEGDGKEATSADLKAQRSSSGRERTHKRDVGFLGP